LPKPPHFSKFLYCIAEVQKRQVDTYQQDENVAKNLEHDETLTANGGGNLVESRNHRLLPLELLLISISQRLFSLLSPGFCSFGSPLSKNLGSIGTLQSFRGSL
jgi:hypothetical protein